MKPAVMNALGKHLFSRACFTAAQHIGTEFSRPFRHGDSSNHGHTFADDVVDDITGAVFIRLPMLGFELLLQFINFWRYIYLPW